MENNGWIKIYRQIQKHWIWDNPDYLKAWIAILITVNHEDNKVLIHGELFNCGRGESLLSLANWAKTFGKGWTIQRTRTFFNLLEKDKMINTEGCRKTTRLNVCNYDSYQEVQQTNNRQTTGKQQADNKQITTNKNDKNDKKNNIDIQQAEHLDENYIKFNLWLKDNASNVLKIKNQISEKEFLKLKGKYSSQEIMNVVECLDNYAPASKKYISVYKTILKWLEKPIPGKNSYSSVQGLSKDEEMFNGKRTYMRGVNRAVIPDDAPPRPNRYSVWSESEKEWKYQMP